MILVVAPWRNSQDNSSLAAATLWPVSHILGQAISGSGGGSQDSAVRACVNERQTTSRGSFLGTDP